MTDDDDGGKMGGVYGLIVRRELAAFSESDSDESEDEDEKVQKGGIVEEEDEEVSICTVIPPLPNLFPSRPSLI